MIERTGLSRGDLLVALAIVVVFGAIVSPAILAIREAARNLTCRNQLQYIGIALQEYHDGFNSLPPAAIWRTDRTQSLALHVGQRFDLFTGPNWVQMILPHLAEEALANRFMCDLPVADPRNEAARLTRLAKFACPSDDFNHDRNPFQYQFNDRAKPIGFARGSYAINGGSHSYRSLPGSSSKLVADGATLIMNESTREFRYAGNGVAGFNVAFAFDDFSNGLTTTVAVDEIRSGIHFIDPRGVWALGQIASSVTWSHGVNGDAGSPNTRWHRSDDIFSASRLHEIVGKDAIESEGMPCVSYIHFNAQAASRSLHQGGVHVLFADGHSRFVSNRVDPGLWHVMHSRETPKHVLQSGFHRALEVDNHQEGTHKSRQSSGLSNNSFSQHIENCVGMEFVLVSPGEFTMGEPNRGQSYEETPECPPHRVRIAAPFYLGKHEVTQAQFRAVMNQNPSFHQPGQLLATKSSDDFPVEQVTWEQANEFCLSLSKLPEEYAAARTYRLPTEAEWEYACRAGKGTYVWSERRDAKDRSGDNAGMEPPLPIKAVGSYPPNEFGLCDMRGNVWEWTADWFDRDYYARSRVIDPQGPSHGYIKVVRGGDYTFVGEQCRLNYPMTPPWKCSRFIGFRVVCDVADSVSR
jgi:prepilin-type processing-associated H-X9-DG protein